MTKLTFPTEGRFYRNGFPVHNNQMPAQQILKKQTQSSEASDYSKFHMVSLLIRSCYCENWLFLAIGNGSGPGMVQKNA